MTSVLPSPSDHLEMPKRMTGRRLVRTCSCGKPWPCEKSAGMRWTSLRDHIRQERATQDDLAAEHAEYGRDDQSERAYGRVEAYDEMLATMDRMGQP
jgi:hypothetical protein